MADDSTIIEGSVKFRDGKKWKSRWCVMRKLSPVADCVQLQMYRDAVARSRGAEGSSKASLSLQQFLGCEAGFTLDKHSNTLALVCRDLVAVLAFETRERLLQWQVKVRLHLGAGRQYVVVVAAAPGRNRRVPAGPARLLLHGQQAALTAGKPPRLLADWDLPQLRRFGVSEGRFCLEGGAGSGRAGAGLHVMVSDRAADIARDFELAASGRLSPKGRKTIPSAESCDPPGDTPTVSGALAGSERAAGGWGGDGGDTWRAASPVWGGDAASLCGAEEAARAAGGQGGGGGGAGGGAAWGGRGGSRMERCSSCMSALGALSRSSTAALTPGARHFSPAWTMEAPAPARPPRLDLTPAAAAAARARSGAGTPLGPYENYDVPRVPSAEIEGEYYDTPRRLRECLDGDAPDGAGSVLRRACGCVLRVRRAGPPVRDCDDGARPAACPCRAFTDWAGGWIGLPSCRRTDRAGTPDDDKTALYATVDPSRKTRRGTPGAGGPDRPDRDDGNYENLTFALSLAHYENARDLLRRAGLSGDELDALTGPIRRRPARLDDYLPMRPGEYGGRTPPSGYAPMSPLAGFAARVPGDKSASNPALTPSGAPGPEPGRRRSRASSVDSARFLEDADRLARDSASSLETLRSAVRPAGSDGDSSEASKRARGPSGAGTPAAGNRDSSSSNDSGVSSCELRCPAAGPGRELPATSAAARRQWRSARRPPAPGTAVRRRSRSSGEPRPDGCGGSGPAPHKCSSAEAEMPLLLVRPLRGVGGGGGGGIADTHSTSSGASDMSDYIETLSICSSHSSTDTPVTMRSVGMAGTTGGHGVGTHGTGAGAGGHGVGAALGTLRPRSGREYLRVEARRAALSALPLAPGPALPPHPHPHLHLPLL